MCLKLNNAPREPLRKGNVRYKVLIKSHFTKNLSSPFRGFVWQRNKEYRANNMSIAGLRCEYVDDGFHVFVTKKDADAWRCRSSRRVVVAVHVRGHIASGTWQVGYGNIPSETWKYAKLVRVFK